MIIGEAKGLKFEDYLFSEVIRTSGRTDNGLVWKPRMNKLKFISGYINGVPQAIHEESWSYTSASDIAIPESLMIWFGDNSG